jgi:hypothetical protein
MSDTLTLNYVLKVFEHNYYCKEKRNVQLQTKSILDRDPDGPETFGRIRIQAAPEW